MVSEYSRLCEARDFLFSKTSLRPHLAVVLGSGLGAFAKSLKVDVSVPFEDIPHYSKPSVDGHGGQLIFGHIGQTPLVCQQGRIHYYEGHDIVDVVRPVRTLGLFGVKTLILTNAAGGLQNGMKPGDLMIIRDHINLMGANPLRGRNLEDLGPRFPDMTKVYDRDIQNVLREVFAKQGLRACEGVYCGLSGPTFETPAEIQYLQKIGADAVGMSTVPEAIAARHMGLKVGGISCITNLGAGLSDQELSHEEVTETGKSVEGKFASLLSTLFERLA